MKPSLVFMAKVEAAAASGAYCDCMIPTPCAGRHWALLVRVAWSLASSSVSSSMPQVRPSPRPILPLTSGAPVSQELPSPAGQLRCHHRPAEQRTFPSFFMIA